MAEYPQNTSGTTTDGILAALIDLVGAVQDLTSALQANTRALAVGEGAPASHMDAASYIDASTGDVYQQQGSG